MGRPLQCTWGLNSDAELETFRKLTVISEDLSMRCVSRLMNDGNVIRSKRIKGLSSFCSGNLARRGA